MRLIIFAVSFFGLFSYAAAKQAEDVKITLLSTMIADYGTPDRPLLGEWGFSALVEVDGQKLLFDTGRTRKTVWENSKALGLDLSDVTDVVLSHFHDDHTGGLLHLRNQLAPRNPDALSRLHVNKHLFSKRKYKGEPAQLNQMIQERKLYEQSGGQVFVYDKEKEIFPGVWISGPVPRVTNEQNYGRDEKFQVRINNQWNVDTVPESLSLYIQTADGTIVVSGCGHAGLVNIIKHSASVTKSPQLKAAIGGFHLLDKDDNQLQWTARELEGVGIEHFIGAHCTGIEATHALRNHLQLTRSQMINGSVGTIYTNRKGPKPTWIVR
ncbi:MBL fold metallo-hydrolase [Biformimicrobium ophioploci]|uniref:MBL fold metallo-hydrolase n=1 Tax=Biformimicrobium ophioploci TaxID=3036711 RepID=A0ABQ6LVY7_9GAMM|nr:MBL fold metallo-hydrolase [Microbulbifer sp. NKW57]GMG86252.1 MBL fold metallo-hydrolase [Microbulbifer sp. NKW57]